MNLTYAELFAGAGGMSLGLEAAGWTCVAHAEIEPHARAVLRKQWPDVPLYGDVSQLDGATLKGITLLTGGSPCQDLSIAGKRGGMVEGSGTRSSLFFEQVRIWKESEAPLILWENVQGAYSSNAGQDFAAVLSALVGAAVPVPADGWRGAGVASGPAGVAAWRSLDAQHFGWDGHTTPQRRRRVFVLGVRAGVCDPAEVLLVADGLLGHLAAGHEAGQGTPADAPAGTPSAGEPIVFAQNTRDEVRVVGGGVVGSLAAQPGMKQTNYILPAVASVDGAFGIRGTITGRSIEKGGPGGSGNPAPTDPMWTLAASEVHAVLTYDARGNGDGATVNTMAGDHQNRVTDYTALVLRNREGKPGGGKGPLVSAEREGTLGTSNDQVVFTKTQYGAYEDAPKVASTLGARDHASLNVDLALGVRQSPVYPIDTRNATRTTDKDEQNRQGSGIGEDGDPSPTLTGLFTPAVSHGVGIPRRLMPVECERLMGWPDQHTAHGIDEQGREYALSDTARYKLCGNGIASPVAAWIGLRLKETLDTTRERV